MRILHTADWHLGKFIYGKSMLCDQTEFIYNTFLPVVDTQKPDAILISGDIFDRAIAPCDAIKLFDSFLDEVCVARKIPLFVSVGNHDGADRFSLGAKLMSSQGFHLSSRLEKNIKRIELVDKNVKVHVYMLPYFDYQTAREITGDENISSSEDAYKVIVDSITENLDKSAYNILMTHCFVSGAALSGDAESSFIGNLQQVESNIFNEFDYVALGHLHAPQNIGKNCRYSGSPLKYSFDEQYQNKSLTMLDINENDFKISDIPLKSLHDMRVISGDFDTLVESGKTDTNNNDYIFAKIMGMPVFEPMARLKEIYPNILGLVNGIDDGEQINGDRQLLRNELRRIKPDNNKIFCSFLSQMCGVQATDEDVALFEHVVKELGGSKR